MATIIALVAMLVLVKTYLPTIIREVAEELNIEIQADQLELLAKTTSDEIRYIRCVYVLRSDITPNFNPNDFVNAAWLFPAELLRNITKGHPAKGNLAETVVLVESYLKNHN